MKEKEEAKKDGRGRGESVDIRHLSTVIYLYIFLCVLCIKIHFQLAARSLAATELRNILHSAYMYFSLIM